jgi:cytochrome c-type biogenesis protein CcmH/NrfG
MSNTTTSLTAAVKALLTVTPSADTKMVLALLAAEYPHISTSYRPVFGTLRRLNQQPAAAPMEDLVAAVQTHAEANWGKNGWDIIAEAYTKAEIAEELLEEGCKSAAAAIRHFGRVAKLKRDHEKEIMSTAW